MKKRCRAQTILTALAFFVIMYIAIIKNFQLSPHRNKTSLMHQYIEHFKRKDERETTRKPACADIRLDLRGRENVTKSVLEFKVIEKNMSDDIIGGQWTPTNCERPVRIAIIIPYRDREIHLKVLLFNLIPKLQRQMVGFNIYVIEQDPNSRFNRGLMRNIGFMEANKELDYDCYIFNDVDTIPEDDRNMYTCHQGAALHMAVSVDRFNYKLLYRNLVGGIISMPEDVFRRVNGYSNMYFTWGAEDDDLRRRLNKCGIPIKRPSVKVAKVTTLKHSLSDVNRSRFTTFVNIGNFSHIDGLNNIKYEVNSVEVHKLFTKIKVKINETYYQNILDQYKRQMKWVSLYNNGQQELNATMKEFVKKQIYGT